MIDIYELVKSLRQAKVDTQLIETKESVGKLPASTIETLSAFANGSGGTIILGLSEKGGFCPAAGFNAKSIADSLADACSNKLTPPLRPIIEILEFESASVVAAKIIEIAPLDKPCYVTERGTYKGSFIRVGDGDRKLSTYEIDKLLEEKTQPVFDREIVESASLDELNQSKIERVLDRQRNLHPRNFAQLSDDEALRNLGIIGKGSDDNMHPTLAGLLALGKYPQAYFPKLQVTFACYPGTEKADSSGVKYLDSQTIVGSVPEILEETLISVRRNMRTGGELKYGFRRDIPDYPEEAVREAVCNALMHRDYSPLARGTQVQVNMFADRLEVLSPGGLYGTVTVDLLGEPGISSTRNQFLSALLETTPYGDKGYVAENRGTGYQLIRAQLSSAGMPEPEVIDSLTLFSITIRKIRKPEEPRPPADKPNEDPIISYIELKGEAKTAEIAEALNMPRRTAAYQIKKLVENDILVQTKPANSPQQSYRVKTAQLGNEIFNQDEFTFEMRDWLALFLFGSEYRLISKLLDMNKNSDPAVGHLNNAVFPFLALTAYESSEWYKKKTGNDLFGYNELLSTKRNLFKYYNDSSFSVNEFDQHCSEVLAESGEFYKRSAGLSAPFAKDAGIFIQDSIPIGSTYTSFRYHYDELRGLDYKNNASIVSNRVRSVGEIIGRYSAFLFELVRQLGGDDGIGSCSSPIQPIKPYDYYLGDLKKGLRKFNGGNPADGVFVILSDAYYMLGLITVLFERGIADNTLAVKLTLLTLYHLRLSINSLVSFSHKDEYSTYNSEICDLLVSLFVREEKQLLKKCTQLRNTLVHYNLPEEISLSSMTLFDVATEFEKILPFNTGYDWKTLSDRILHIGKSVRARLEEALGVPEEITALRLNVN